MILKTPKAILWRFCTQTHGFRTLSKRHAIPNPRGALEWGGFDGLHGSDACRTHCAYRINESFIYGENWLMIPQAAACSFVDS